jgi:hypothetical protein
LESESIEAERKHGTVDSVSERDGESLRRREVISGIDNLLAILQESQVEALVPEPQALAINDYLKTIGEFSFTSEASALRTQLHAARAIVQAKAARRGDDNYYSLRTSRPMQTVSTVEQRDLATNMQAASTFPTRAAWTHDRLKERGWDHNHPMGWGGPDRKTMQRILKGLKVKPDTLSKLVVALNKAQGRPKIGILDIPDN